MALTVPSIILQPSTTAKASKGLSEALLASPGLFGADGRDVLVILVLADRDTNRWQAMGSYRVGKAIIRTRTASGTGPASALAAMLQGFIPRHAGRRWRLMGEEAMAGWVPKPRRRY